MRALTTTERNRVSAAAGHWCFAYLEVTNADGAWINVGDVAVGPRTVDFLNTITWSDDIDANTLSMSATMLREAGAYSLAPFRTDSPLNVKTGGLYAPLLDLHRQWRLMGVILPRGTYPTAPDYREWASGIVDRIDIQGDPATITVQGRGREADLIDARIIDVPKTYAAANIGPFLQSVLDGQHGVGVVPLTLDASAPSFFVNALNQDTDIGEMELLTSIASLPGAALRYRYSATDVLTLTLFTPNRSASAPDWSIGADEYETLDAGIDLSGIRNYVIVRYDDASTGLQTVTSPATPSSASITRYGLRTMVVDLAASTQITTAADAQAFADAIRSDLEFPNIEQSVVGHGLWFVGLGDYVQLVANGVHYTEDQYGGVTRYSHTFANGELASTLGLRGQPAGRYRTWLQIGSGVGSAPSAPLLPEVGLFTPEFYDYNGSAYGAFIYGLDYGARCLSIRVEYGNDATFATTVVTHDYDAAVDFPPILDGYGLVSSAERDKTWYFRATPYSGPVVAGAPTGVPGVPVVKEIAVPPSFSPPFTTLTDGPTITWATGGARVNNAAVTLAGNRTLAITGAVDGAEGYLEVTQDAVGARTLTLPSGTIVGGTTSIASGANKKTAIAWTYKGAAFTFVLAQQG